MNSQPNTPREFPPFFLGILIKSLTSYKNAFLSYLILAAVTYLPFMIFSTMSELDIQDMIEFFHGNFLDIIIFLTLPTVFRNNQVFPFATIQLFFQRFFASAVVISLIQLGTLLFFMTFFVQISLGAILLGMIPYIFLLFAGFFLIMENSSKIISIRANLLNSIKVVKKQFFPIFLNYINITLLMFVPLFVFSLWYLSTHPEVVPLMEMLQNKPENELAIWQSLISVLQSTIQEGGFMWSRVGIHVLFRPIKSLFLCFLFLGIFSQIAPDPVRNFLGTSSPSTSDTPSQDPIEVPPEDSKGPESSSDDRIH